MIDTDVDVADDGRCITLANVMLVMHTSALSDDVLVRCVYMQCCTVQYVC